MSLLGEFGYKVDIACPDTPGHLETLALLGIQRLPVEHLWSIPFERYDLVVIGTVMHVGYNRLDMFQPLPGTRSGRKNWSTFDQRGPRPRPMEQVVPGGEL